MNSMKLFLSLMLAVFSTANAFAAGGNEVFCKFKECTSSEGQCLTPPTPAFTLSSFATISERAIVFDWSGGKATFLTMKKGEMISLLDQGKGASKKLVGIREMMDQPTNEGWVLSFPKASGSPEASESKSLGFVAGRSVDLQVDRYSTHLHNSVIPTIKDLLAKILGTQSIDSSLYECSLF